MVQIVLGPADQFPRHLLQGRLLRQRQGENSRPREIR